MKIVVRTDDLIDIIQDIIEDRKDAIELEIDEHKLFIATLECGGTGYCNDYEPIIAMTQSEIERIP